MAARRNKFEPGAAAVWTVAAIVPWLFAARPCQAADAQPFAQVAAVGAYDGNISGHSDVSISPWNAVYTKGPADWHGGLVAGGGVNVDLDDRLSTLCVVDVAGQRYVDYPALSGFLGSASVQGKAVDLPGDIDALLTYTFREDFQGDSGHDVSGGIERPLPFAVVGASDIGYDWSLAADSALGYQGPYADVGASRRFRATGTWLGVRVTGLFEAYPSRTDGIVSTSAEVSQDLGRQTAIFGRVSYDWVYSTQAGSSLSSPEFLLGTVWTYP